MNEQTVVGVFQDNAEAMLVRDELIHRGFPADDVRITSSDSRPGTAHDDGEDRGGIAGFFRSLFGGQDHENEGLYADAVARGSAVVTAEVSPDRLREAEEIMEQHHPIDITESRDEMRGASGMQGMDANAQAIAGDMGIGMAGGLRQESSAQDNTQRIPVIEENLVVGKREVERGRVRVFTRMEETPVEEEVRLREEHARVERHPVDRPATEADLRGFGDGETIEIRETTEEPVVTKTARVVEEVEVGTETSERTDTVRETVRHTQVDVEDVDTRDGGRSTGRNKKG